MIDSGPDATNIRPLSRHPGQEIVEYAVATISKDYYLVIHFIPWLGVSAIEKANKRSRDLAKDALLKYEAELVEGIIESKTQYRKIVKAGISQWVRDFQRGMIEVKTVEDLKRLIELDLELQRDEV